MKPRSPARNRSFLGERRTYKVVTMSRYITAYSEQYIEEEVESVYRVPDQWRVEGKKREDLRLTLHRIGRELREEVKANHCGREGQLHSNRAIRECLPDYNQSIEEVRSTRLSN